MERKIYPAAQIKAQIAKGLAREICLVYCPQRDRTYMAVDLLHKQQTVHYPVGNGDLRT